MPVFITVLAVDYEMPNRYANFYPISHYTPTWTSFNSSSLPPGDEKFRQYFLNTSGGTHSSHHPIPSTLPSIIPSPSLQASTVASPSTLASPSILASPPRFSPAPSSSPSLPPAPPSAVPSASVSPDLNLFKAINFNGSTTTVGEITYQNHTQASVSVTGTPFSNQNVTLTPAVNSQLAQIIRSSIYGSGGCCSNRPEVRVPNVPSGTYSVYVYTWEDNNSEKFDLYLETLSNQVLDDYVSGPAGSWRKHGPYQVNITDGTLNLFFRGGNANLSALEIWRNQAASSVTTIQAEDYLEAFDTTSGNTGGQYRNYYGVDIQNTGDTGGGYNVGWTAPNEWLKYNFNSSAGPYRLRARVAHTLPGASFQFSIDDRIIGTMSIPNTSGWQSFTTISSETFNLNPGQHSLKVIMQNAASNGAVGNFNYFELIQAQ